MAHIERLSDLTSALDVEAKAADFTRWLIALAATGGDPMAARAHFSARWPNSKNLRLIQKGAIATTSAASLMELSLLSTAFIEGVRPATILGRLPGVRRVPINVRVPAATTSAAVTWVGAGAPISVSAPSFTGISLKALKISGIVVITDESARSSSPAAEELIAADLRASSAAFLDRALLDPAAAEVVGISPASITNGVAPIAATGTGYDDFLNDARQLFGQVANASAPTFILHPQTAVGVATLTPSAALQEIGWRGGTLFGCPAITSASAPAGAIIQVDASALVVGEDGMEIDVSREGAVEMQSAPTNPPTAATVMVSLWQTNMTGIRITCHANWRMARPGSIGWISGASYGA